MWITTCEPSLAGARIWSAGQMCAADQVSTDQTHAVGQGCSLSQNGVFGQISSTMQRRSAKQSCAGELARIYEKKWVYEKNRAYEKN